MNNTYCVKYNSGKISTINNAEYNEYYDRLIAKSGRIFRPVEGQDKYQFVEVGYSKTQHDYVMCRCGGEHNQAQYVHKLVAEQFLPNGEHKATVNHKNHHRDDNRLSNLNYMSWSENIADAKRWKGSRFYKGV